MLTVPCKRIWTQQPQYPAALDGSVRAIMLPSVMADYVIAKILQSIGSHRLVVNKQGKAVAFSGSSVGIKIGAGGWESVVPNTDAIFFVCAFTRTSITNAEWIFGDYNANGDANQISIGVRLNAGSTTATVRVRMGAANLCEQSVSGFTVGGHTLVLSIKNGAGFMVLDGTRTILSVSAGDRNTGYSARIGSGGDYTSQYFSGQINLFGVGQGLIAQEKSAAISLQPWQIFRAPYNRVWIPSAAGAGCETSISSTTGNVAGSISSISTSRSAISATLAQTVGSVASRSTAKTAITATTENAVGSIASSNSGVCATGVSATTANVTGSIISKATSKTSLAATLGNAIGAISSTSVYGVTTTISATLAGAIGAVFSSTVTGPITYARAPDGRGYNRMPERLSRPPQTNTGRPLQTNTVRP